MGRKLIGRPGAAAQIPAAAAYNARRPVTASAARINLRNREETQEVANQTQRSRWQEDAWRVYDAIGEIKFAYGLVASVMSRLRLFPAFVEDPESEPISLVDAANITRPDSEGEEEAQYERPVLLSPQRAKEARDMYNKAVAKTSISNLLRSFALNISVPGECYLALINGEWQVKSKDELRVTSGGASLYRTPGARPKDLPPDATVGRIWREHPRYSYDSDSALRSLIDDCDELLLLSRVIRSNSRARLNAGILYVPDEVTAAARTESDDSEVEEAEEVDFEKMLYDALAGPVASEDNPNTVMPLLLRGPGDLGKYITHIKLERVIDEFLVNRADRTLERILQGLDVPKDIVTGLANVKYSNAIQIDENLYKAHIEPLALIICDAFTDIVLRPLLRGAGWGDDEIARIVVWYDPSEVVTRPDRAADASKLYDADELSGSALRAAHGFTDNDAPDEEELARRLAIKGQIPEGVMNVLLAKVLPTVLKQLQHVGGGPGGLPDSMQQVLDGGAPEDLATPPGLDPTIPGGATSAAAPDTTSAQPAPAEA